jgi:hypothetical protein
MESVKMIERVRRGRMIHGNKRRALKERGKERRGGNEKRREGER